MWEPVADYNHYNTAADPVKNRDMKHSQPLQTIGDILYDQGELNPRTYAEYSHNNGSPYRVPGRDYVPGQLYPDGEHHEEDEEGNPKTFKRVLVRFAERTSMQGVPYIYVSSVWYAKLGWSLLFFVGFCLMVGHLYLLFDEFYQYDTHSTVTLGFSTLVFPAVTICNVNPIKQSKMYMAPPELRDLVEAVQPTNIAGSMEAERNKLAGAQGGVPSTGNQQTGQNQQNQGGDGNQQTSGQQNLQSLTGTKNEQSSTGQQNQQPAETEGTKTNETLESETTFYASTITTTTAIVDNPDATMTTEPQNVGSEQQSTTTRVADTFTQDVPNAEDSGKTQTQVPMGAAETSAQGATTAEATVGDQTTKTTATSPSTTENTSVPSLNLFETSGNVTTSDTTATTTSKTVIENGSTTVTTQGFTTESQENQNLPVDKLNQDVSGNASSNPAPGTSRRRRSLNEIHEETVKKRYKRFINGFSIEESNNRKVDDKDGGPSGNKSTIRAIEDEFRFLFSTMGREQRYEMGHDIDEMLMECTFRGITCDATQFRLAQTAQYGNCYTLENTKYISTVGGPDDGLTLYLFMEDEEFLHGITNSMGIQVHIHNIGELPNPYSEGLSVSAGMETYIGLKKVNIQRQKHPYGECVNNESFKELYNLTYTQRTCQAFCLQKTIVNECGCFDAENDEVFKSLATAQIVVRPDNASLTYNPCRNEEESECYRSQVRRFQNQEFECDCASPCKESLYTKSLSSKIWPTEEYAGILVEYLCSRVNETTCATYKQKSRSEIATSFLKMVIYYEDLNYENITEEVDYETFQFVSDVGGTIGLWIGLSMISFFEVIQFMYEMVHYFIYTKPKLAKEKARKEKLREAKHNSTHALKFIKSNGMTPMFSATSKLMTSGSADSKSSGQKKPGPKRTSKPKEGSGSAKDSGTGGDSLQSEKEHHSHNRPHGKRDHAPSHDSHLWHNEKPNLDNHGYRGDRTPGLRDMSMISSPAVYAGAPYRGPGVDPRDVDVNFAHHKNH